MPQHASPGNSAITRPCRLCRLPARLSSASADPAEPVFCCNGCRMVYAMIMESGGHSDSDDFTQTDLFRQCVAAGIIPDPSGNNPPGNNHTVETERSAAHDSHSNTTDTGHLLSFHFHVRNMWCPACAWVVENSLSRTQGVIEATCNFSSDRGSVLYDPTQTAPEKIFSTITGLGYHAAHLDQKNPGSIRTFIRLVTTGFLTMNVMMLSWAIYSGFFMDLPADAVQMLGWPSFLMASIVLFYGGYPIHCRTFSNLRSGLPGMETLISIGSISTYLYSIVQLIKGSIHLYFDASCMLILLVLIGKMLEQSAKKKISNGLSEFFSLIPRKVKICTKDFPTGRYAAIEQLTSGDTFVSQMGEILPADGRIISGSAVIDESSITGEARPFSAEPQDTVKSGTRIISGKIKVLALKVGDDAILGRMLAVMEQSLSGKPRQAQRFETILKFFVPAVIGLSILTFFFWLASGLPVYEAFSRGICVLVISCPCALGIAVPLALVAGVSAAGKRGILVRDFEAFERMGSLDTIIFDKTGTLTTGKMNILGIDHSDEITHDTAWSLICSMETASDHYIARTIQQYTEKNHISLCRLEQLTCHDNGMSCRFKGQSWHLGSMDFAIQNQKSLPGFISAPSDSVQVISTVFLSRNGQPVAAVHLGDAMKQGIRTLIQDLKKMGIATYIISGDASVSVTAAASFAGIPGKNTRSGLLPHEKADFITGLRQSGRKTAMVGDGINDAPAMAVSDLAIAVRSGLQPGEGVAAATFMRETPIQLLDFKHLSEKVSRKVEQNLLFALIYNTISIPVAALGLLNPIIAATAMLLSSLSVTLNTLLLVRREADHAATGEMRAFSDQLPPQY